MLVSVALVLHVALVVVAVLAQPVVSQDTYSTRKAVQPAACKIDDWERRDITRCSRLFLHYAKIGDDGAVELAVALRGSQVTSLSLFGCGIGDRGAIALAEAMEEVAGPLIQLEILNLAGNNIGDAGAVALGHALRVYGALKDLNLSDNTEITDVGVKAIAEGLDAANGESELHTLNLWGVRKISQSGVAAMVKVCETQHSLVTVILQPRAEIVDADLTERMQMALGRNKKIKRYNLDPRKTPVTMTRASTMGENQMTRSKKDEL